MATHNHYHPAVAEDHHVADSDASSSAMMAVLLVAAVLIIGFLLFAMRAFPFNNAGTANRTIDITLPAAEAPATTPDSPAVNVNNTNTQPVTPGVDY